MIRVLHLCRTAYPDSVGGIQQFIHQMGVMGNEFGVKTTVLTLAPGKLIQLNPVDMGGYQLYRAKQDFEVASNTVSLHSFGLFSRLAQQADIIHYHFPWPFMDVVHFVTRIKKPCILTYHSDIVRQQNMMFLYRPLMKRFLTSMNQIVATSPNYLESSEVLQKFKDKTCVVPLGIDNRLYPKAKKETLTKWTERIKGRFFLFIGVLRYYKGVHILLRAMRETDMFVVIAGSGPEESKLKQLAIDLNLDNVYFAGEVQEEDKTALLNLCYAVIMPSHLRSEAFGISLIEAAMFSKAMISCDIGTGTSFVNVANKTGLVVKPDEVEALREAMQILWLNPPLTGKMGENARKRYVSTFTATRMVGEYTSIYKRFKSKHL